MKQVRFLFLLALAEGARAFRPLKRGSGLRRLQIRALLRLPAEGAGLNRLRKKGGFDPNFPKSSLRAYCSGKKTVPSFPTHFRKKRGNGWGTQTVFSCRINKGLVDFAALSVRLKSCPVTRHSNIGVFPQLVKSIAFASSSQRPEGPCSFRKRNAAQAAYAVESE
jgi:hypothetical protein